MKAPEKIYIYPSDRAGEEYEDEWGDKPWGEDCVEYTHTNAFIEKACAWLKTRAEDSDYTWYNEFEHESGITDKCIEDFRKYMKGE